MGATAPFNTAGPLQALYDLLTTLTVPGLQRVYIGAPESFSNQVSAYVAVAGQRIVDKATGLLQREARYLVVLGYRVKDHEDTAETTLAAIVDAFVTAIYQDRTLAGWSRVTSVDLTQADTPQYEIVAGQEYRRLPMVVTVLQSQTYPQPTS
jgi:hypothetical protein